MFEFRKVKCHSYLKRVRDGRMLDVSRDRDGSISGVRYMGIGDDIPDECKCEGAYEFLKTYYKKVEAEFDGVLVGTTTVTMDAYLYGDTGCEPWGSECLYIGKSPNTILVCGVVYYQNNRKRYVPLVDIEGEEPI